MNDDRVNIQRIASMYSAFDFRAAIHLLNSAKYYLKISTGGGRSFTSCFNFQDSITFFDFGQLSRC